MKIEDGSRQTSELCNLPSAVCRLLSAVCCLIMISYFARLTLRLAAGVERLDARERRQIASFFRARQDSSGGFTGRQGRADIYYTSFAVRGLALLGEPDVPGIESYLVQKIGESQKTSLSCTETISLFFAAHLWEAFSGRTLLERVPDPFERFRREDGGYASSEKAAFSSTYHTFLVSALLEHLAPDTPVDANELCRFLQRRQRSDGGFVELEPLKHSGTNPTVAGLGLLACLRNRSIADDMRAELKEGALRYLRGCQTSSGGFQANGRIPAADLLSTFTVLTAFYEEGCENQIDLAAARNFVQSLKRETPDGLGYVGGPWDNEPDVEYTFYGLAAECLLEG
ncbi:MAG: geranyl transferase [Planctomycetaceae bacterium]|nr:geranyl transferase [Planctomycetaceae bacterium]